MFKYKYKKEHIHYMKEQVFEAKTNLRVYSALSELEHEQTKEFIGFPRTVMDLGCGLGRAGIYLNHSLNDNSIHFIMADSTGDTDNAGLWDIPAVYNNLHLTKSFCETNGMQNFETFDVFRDDWERLKDVDLIISHCSVGVHFPIEDVLENLLKISSKDCTMIFGLRKGLHYTSASFKDFFQTTVFIDTMPLADKRLPWQNWLILKDKI